MIWINEGEFNISGKNEAETHNMVFWGNKKGVR
jgi:hypothetical protein